MEKFVINGGKPLKGSVHISGAKNAAVAILPAVLLCDEPCVVENLPEISDVATLLRAIKQLGADVRAINKSTVEIDPRPANSFVIDKKNAGGGKPENVRLLERYYAILTADEVMDGFHLQAISITKKLLRKKRRSFFVIEIACRWNPSITSSAVKIA